MALAVLLPLILAAGLLARRTTTPRNPAFSWEQVK
jgi:hypothetical protein